MGIFIKAAAGALIALILSTVLSKHNKDISLLLMLAVCSMILISAVKHLEPVISFFKKLQDVGQLDGTMIKVLLKSVGIGLLGEIVGFLCADAGNAALGKTLQMLASCVILWLSLPLFESLLELVEGILKLL